MGELLAYFYFTNESTEKKEAKPYPLILKEKKRVPVFISPKDVEKLPVNASTKNIKQKTEPIQKTIELQPEEVSNSDVEKIIPEEIAPTELPVKEEKIVEPEPTNLYDQLKKNQKGKEKRELFIEKKE